MNESECSCDLCKKCCNRPCWPTPAEAAKLINAGFGSRLMADYWSCTDREDINIVSPACVQHEGRSAPSFAFRTCTFFNIKGECELHSLKLKPIEGRVTNHDRPEGGLHEEVANMWDTDEGRETFKLWKEQFYELQIC